MINPERYRKIDEIFQQALQISPDERESFISQACEGDEPLLREVESLLSSEGQVWELIESPVFEMAAPLLAKQDQELSTGEKLGHYNIVSLLGVGGMGQVYLAEDARLGRKVALKLLPANFTQNESRLRRFQQEARAASALNHPNILTIHDVLETEERHIIVTEYVEGESLRHRIKQGSFIAEEALDIIIQVASALSAAHQANIIHRDIKPENIMLRRDGLVKILDFGLAKLVESPLPDTGRFASIADMTKRESVAHTSKAEGCDTINTESGQLMGTLPYMSPEQLQGMTVDARTDIFSLGVVIYEMIANCLPFDAKTNAELIHSIIEAKPEPLSRHVSGQGAQLQKIIDKALRKNREERYESVADLLTELRALRQEAGLTSKGESPEPGGSTGRRTVQGIRPFWQTNWTLRTKMIAGILLLCSICAGILPSLLFIRSEKVRAVATQKKAIAVLPFKSIGEGEGDEYLRLGVAETLINKLGGIRQIIVRPLASVIQYGNQDQDPISAGRQLGVDVVLDGQIQKIADRYKVTVQLWQVSDSSALTSYACNEQCATIFDLQDVISERVANVLVAHLLPEEQQYLARRYTSNKDVYDLFLKGRFYWNKKTSEDYKKSIEYFNQAIQLDKNYAPAYSGLADAYVSLAWFDDATSFDVTEKGKAAAIKAIEIDDNLAEAHASLAYVKFYQDWDWPGAEKEFERAIALKPNYVTAIQWYAYALAAVGQSDKAILMAKTALELDPLSVISNVDLGLVYVYARHPDEAIEQLQKTLALEPDREVARGFLLHAYAQKRMYDELVEEYLSLKTSMEEKTTIRNIYTTSGFRGFCQYRLHLALKDVKHKYVSPFVIACLYALVGDNDKTMEWLEKSYQAHERMMVYIKVDERLDGLRSDPRFKEMIQRVGLPE